MPRTAQEILDHADELAKQFEDSHPVNPQDATPLREIRQAVIARAEKERELAEAVSNAREAGLSWNVISMYLGTSGEAARQRYGQKVNH